MFGWAGPEFAELVHRRIPLLDYAGNQVVTPAPCLDLRIKGLAQLGHIWTQLHDQFGNI